MISTILLGFLRSRGPVQIDFWISVAALCIKGLLNYMLIFGNFGIPVLGIEGAAVATLIVWLVECTMVVIYTFKKIGLSPGQKLTAIPAGFIYIKTVIRGKVRYSSGYLRCALPPSVLPGFRKAEYIRYVPVF